MALPASKQRLLNFDLAELPRDVNGLPDGPLYRPYLDIADMHAHRNMRSEVQGVWTGRSHVLASLGEKGVFFDLEANPFVISIREGYPWFSSEVRDDVRDGKPVAANRVMTIDFVLTLRPANFGGRLRYVGLSRKPQSLARTPAVQRRSGREQRALEQVGWSWSAVKTPSATRLANLEKLRGWAKAAPIDYAARDAATLSEQLYKSTSTKDLDRLLRMLGKRLGIAPDDRYFVFAAAFYFGYVGIEQDAWLDEDAQVMLIRPPRKPCGVFVHG